MDFAQRVWEKIFAKLLIFYIELVYKTSRISVQGVFDLLRDGNEEKFVIGFWHGDSYGFYPLLKGHNIFVITTRNQRGNYVADICRHFGYLPIRMPDERVDGRALFKIRKLVGGSGGGNLALTLDGPLGPYHEPHDFVLFTAYFLKRRVVPASIQVKRKIQLWNRWDKYVIPLPFNRIEVFFHEPVTIAKGDVAASGEKIANVLEREHSSQD